MKLVTFKQNGALSAGVLRDEQVITLNYPTLLELLQDPQGMNNARAALASNRQGVALHTVILLSPIPSPPTMRDFYAFEQHVKHARFKRGVDMIPEWYEIPTFYFTNTS